MSNKKQKGKSREGYFANYKTSKVWETNRERKLLRALELNPNNKQIELALKNIHYRRGTPKKSQWSHSAIATAKLFKLFVGKFDRNVTSPDPKIQAAAVRVRNENAFEQFKGPNFNQNSMFSLKERAHSQNGMRVWI